MTHIFTLKKSVWGSVVNIAFLVFFVVMVALSLHSPEPKNFTTIDIIIRIIGIILPFLMFKNEFLGINTLVLYQEGLLMKRRKWNGEEDEFTPRAEISACSNIEESSSESTSWWLIIHTHSGKIKLPESDFSSSELSEFKFHIGKIKQITVRPYS